MKAFVLCGSYHYHGGFPVFGNSLRFVARSLNDLVEPILGILDRRTSANTTSPLLARISFRSKTRYENAAGGERHWLGTLLSFRVSRLAKSTPSPVSILFDEIDTAGFTHGSDFPAINWQRLPLLPSAGQILFALDALDRRKPQEWTPFPYW